MYWILPLSSVLFGQSLDYSWNDQLAIIVGGTFTGRNGYPRGYISRSDPGFRDSMMVYLLLFLASNRTRIDDIDFLYAPFSKN